MSIQSTMINFNPVNLTVFCIFNAFFASIDCFLVGVRKIKDEFEFGYKSNLNTTYTELFESLKW